MTRHARQRVASETTIPKVVTRVSASPDLSIEVEDVRKRYGRTEALKGVSLEVRTGELFALLGPNGAGKTTLVHILCTIHRPDSGVARVAGIDVARNPVAARQNIGVVFQESTLDERLTVEENLEFHGLIYGVPTRLRKQRIRDLLEIVELSEWKGHVVRALSSGMKRRLEIARALVHDSQILFLDEPTVGLDAQSRERIWEHIATLQKERNLTILVTTHYLAEVEECDRICIVDHGEILAQGTPERLKTQHGYELLRVVPRTDGDREAILEKYAGRMVSENDELVMKSDGEVFVEQFLGSFGGRISAMNLEKPSLESVFLNLTGRELRDQTANARERTLAFGKRGGEHTR